MTKDKKKCLDKESYQFSRKENQETTQSLKKKNEIEIKYKEEKADNEKKQSY